MKTSQELEKELVESFPTASPGFISVILEALEIHSLKRHDYNGENSVDKFDLGLKSRFTDINRKFARLYHIIWENNEPKVTAETAIDTAMDLGNYAFLMVEELRKMNK